MTTHDESATALTWKMAFTPYAKSVRLARHQVRKILTTWGYGDDDIATVVVVCSELATNAVEHAHQPGRHFEVKVTAADGSCLIEVSDALRAGPRPATPDDEDERGRGLQVIAELSESTGSHPREPVGKTVWARLRLNPPHPDEGRTPR